MKIFFTLDKQTRNNFLILFIFGLLFWASVTSMLPTLPSYIKSVGGKDQQIGLVMGSFAIGLLICRSWLGKIADEKSRKEVILIGTFVAAIAPIGFALFTSIPILFALRAFHGISVAAFTTGYSALIVDLAPFAIRGEIIGYMSLVTPIGIAIGPALGGLLEEKIGYVALFLFGSLLGLISTIGLTQIKEKREIYVKKNLSDDQTKENYVIKIFTNHALVIPSVVLLMIGFGMGGLTTFIPLYIKQTNIDFSAGLFYSMAAVASFISRLFTGKGSDRFGRGIFLAGSLISYTLAMLLLSQAKTSLHFLFAAILEGMGTGTLLPMMIALLSDRSAPTERGRIFSLCVSGFDLGIAISAPLFGYLVGIFNYRGIFAICAGLSLMATLIFITQCSPTISHSLRFSLKGGKDLYKYEEN